MLVSARELLDEARRGKYAVAAFNFYNLDTLMAEIEAAEAERSPVIVQIYEAHFLHYDGGAPIAAAALERIRLSEMPVCLHLDHADRTESVRAAVDDGFGSVMFDGSALPLEENIALSREAVACAHAAKVFTEVELGRIGRISGDEETSYDDCTGVEEAVRLIKESGADSLAPAIGTAHGIYKKTPELNFTRLAELRDAVGVPLVLHGGSGIPDEMIRRAIATGIVKINVGTELKYTWSATMLAGLSAGEKEPIRLASDAVAAVREAARAKLRLFGSSGKA